MMATSSPSRQLLVRFQDRTYLLCPEREDEREEVADYAVLEFIARRTRWPVERLELVPGSSSTGHHHQSSSPSPFRTVRAVSAIRGGKGGFGTLLRGSYRKQKASVVDYGDCRTLTGQRLRNVVTTGEGSTASLLRLPSQGQSLPAWAPLNASKLASQHLRRLERTKKRHDRERETAKREKDAAKARRADQVASYVEAASRATTKIERSLQGAIQQGIATAKRKQEQQQQEQSERDSSSKRQRTAAAAAEEEEEEEEELLPSSSLVCLSGDLDIFQQQQQQQSLVSLRGSSNFGTAAVLLQDDSDTISAGPGAKSSTVDATRTSSRSASASLYYEVAVLTGGLVQAGWADFSVSASSPDDDGETFRPDSEQGLGVGDCPRSWAVDLSRSLKLHADREQPFGTVAADSDSPQQEWKAGDVVGCLRTYDPEKKLYRLSYTLNGQDLGTAFEISEKDEEDDASRLLLFPAVSVNPDEVVELHLHESEMKYFPASTGEDNKAAAVPVGRFLASTTTTAATTDAGSTTTTTTPSSSSQSQSKQGKDKKGKKKSPPSKPEPKNPPNDDAPKAADETKKTAAAAAPPPPPPSTEPPFRLEDLMQYDSIEQLGTLGLDRLKSALMTLGCKCGGTQQERAARLFSLRGIDGPSNIPERLRTKTAKRK